MNKLSYLGTILGVVIGCCALISVFSGVAQAATTLKYGPDRPCAACVKYSDFANSVGQSVGVKPTFDQAIQGVQATINNTPVDLTNYVDVKNGAQSAANMIKSQDNPIYCVFMAPAITNEEYTPAGLETKNEIGGYGPRWPDGVPMEPQESDLNKKLRVKRPGITIESQWQSILDTAKNDMAHGTKKVIVYLPDSAQAEEYLSSGKYTAYGYPVEAGKKYKANSTDPETGYKFDEDCNMTKEDVPKPGSASNPFMPGTQPGNFTPGGAPQGPGAGLESLLPLLLMQSLLGGQGQNGAGGKNGLGGNNSNGAALSTNCAFQGVYPVCGSDNKTYNNTCWLQTAGVTQTSTGVCSASTTSPSFPDVTNIATQIAGSGMPQGLWSSIIAELNTIFHGQNLGSVNVP